MSCAKSSRSLFLDSKTKWNEKCVALFLGKWCLYYDCSVWLSLACLDCRGSNHDELRQEEIKKAPH